MSEVMLHLNRPGWRMRKLGELFRIKHGYAFKGEFFSDSGPFIVLTPGNFDEGGGFRLKGEKEKYYRGDFPLGYLLKKGELLVVMTEQAEGLLGSPALIPASNLYLHNQRLGLVEEVKFDEVDKRYLYYLFNSRSVRQQIRSTSSGTKVRHTSPSRIYEVETLVPPVAEQRRISDILSAYDDLIENNTRRIALLEKLAQSLYREWFIHFRFPGHENVPMVESEIGPIPEGWSIHNLFDVADVTYGHPFKSKLFNTDNQGMPVIRIRDIKAGATQTFTTEPATHRYIVQNGDLVIGMDGDFHIGKWAGGQAYLNQRVVRFRPKGHISQYFLLLSLSEPIKTLNATIVGTTVAHLSDRDLRSIKFIMPGLRLAAKAKLVLDPIYELELALRLKNAMLRQTRDLLLPKLISGEIEVSALAGVTG